MMTCDEEKQHWIIRIKKPRAGTVVIWFFTLLMTAFNVWFVTFLSTEDFLVKVLIGLGVSLISFICVFFSTVIYIIDYQKRSKTEEQSSEE